MLLILTGTLLVTAFEISDNVAARAEFRAFYDQHWQFLHKTYGNCAFSYSFQAPVGRGIQETRVHGEMKVPFYLYTTHTEIKNASASSTNTVRMDEIITGQNSLYYFSIIRKPDGKLAIGDLVMKDAMVSRDLMYPPVLAPIGDAGLALLFSELQSDPRVTFAEFGRGQWQGKDAVQCTVNVNLIWGPERQPISVLKQYYFDTTDGSRIGSIGQGVGSSQVREEIEYQVKRGQKIIKSIRRVHKVGDNETVLHVTEFAEHKTGMNYPNENFTLSAFGLEEPFGVEWPQPTPWWLYLAGGTVFFFVLALLFGVAIRRLNARVAG